MRTLLTAAVSVLISASAFADLNTGLIAYYQFNGNGNNSAGSSLNLTEHSVTYQPGLFGQAAAFNGFSSYLQSSDVLPITGDDSRTVSVWLYANSYWGNKSILQWGSWASSGYSWAIYLEPPSSGSAIANAHWVDFINPSSPNSYGTGNWFNLIVMYDGSTRTADFYLNGKELGGVLNLGDPAGINTASGLLTVGNNDLQYTPYSDVWISPWDGLMDDVRIYNRVLTLNEINQLNVVPEPSSMALLLTGVSLILYRKNRN